MEIVIVANREVANLAIGALTSKENSSNVSVIASDKVGALQFNEATKALLIYDISQCGNTCTTVFQNLIEHNSSLKILALATDVNKELVTALIDIGVTGLLRVDNIAIELLVAIQKIGNEELYLDSAFTRTILNKTETTSKNREILQTKLHRPPLTKDVLIRPRIIQQFESHKELPFSLVSAPAGYGKSIAVSQWLQHTNLKHTWISLDEEHNDFRAFLSYFKAGIDSVFPNVLRELEGYLMSGNLPPVKVLSYAVINDLDKVEEAFIVALDDYHKIKNQQIHDFIDILLAYPPEKMHLCMLTRIDPPLKLNVLLVNNRMHEVRMADLSFSNSEISDLFFKLNNKQLNNEIAGVFYDKTEGWVVSLRMAFLNVKKVEDAENILAKLKGNKLTLSLYLLEEVIKKQPLEIQQLLLSTAVLNRFCAELIDEVLASHFKGTTTITGQHFIDWLEDRNLFIISLDDEQNWFRYHHLIQELLLERLSKNNSKEAIEEIHERAGGWFAKHHFVEEAIKHMLAAGNRKKACDIIEQNRMAELDNDNWFVVQKWLKMIPEHPSAKGAGLLLGEAWVAYENFQLEKTYAIVEQLLTVLDDGDAKNRVLLGEANLLMGVLFVWSGKGAEALGYLDKAPALLPENYKLIMGMLKLHHALAKSIIGEKDQALQQLQKELNEGHENPMYVTRLLAGIFYVNMFAAQLPKAIDGAKRAQNASKKRDMAYTKGMARCMEGTALFFSFKLEEAIRKFDEISAHPYNLHVGTALDALAGKTIAHQLLDQTKEADAALALLKRFERENSSSNKLPISSSCRARLSLIRGDITSAMELERTIDEQPGYANTFVWVEVPVLTQIRVLIFKNEAESLLKATVLVDAFLETTRKLHLINQVIEALVLKALIHYRQRKKPMALKVLEEALQHAQPGRFIRPFIEAGTPMKGLLLKAEFKGVSTAFKKELLQHFEKLKRDSYQKNIQNKKTRGSDLSNLITTREREIIVMLDKGMRNKEIADTVNVAEGTVKKHIYNICKKWNVNNRIGILNLAKQCGLL